MLFHCTQFLSITPYLIIKYWNLKEQLFRPWLFYWTERGMVQVSDKMDRTQFVEKNMKIFGWVEALWFNHTMTSFDLPPSRSRVFYLVYNVNTVECQSATN